MIEKLDTKMECVEISVLGNKKAECLDFEAGRKLNFKINELIDAVNELQNRIDPPSVYQVMKDKDAIIGKHIGEKQRLQDELERTRKALDVAVDALKELEEKAYLTEYAQGVVAKALKEITALEKKDK